MGDTKFRVPKATVLLLRTQETLQELFAACERPGPRVRTSKQEAFELLRRELLILWSVQEDVFDPALERAAGPSALLAEARERRQGGRRLLAELSREGPDGDAFDAKLRALHEHVERQGKEEEHALFPIYDGLPHATRVDVAEELRGRRAALEAWPL